MDDLQMGWGRQYFSNGNSYEGDFRYGEMTFGNYRFKSGKSYEGEFNNGNFSGQGTLYDNDGTRIEGLFRDDEVNGYATQWGWSDRGEEYIMYEGNFLNGSYDG